MQQQERMSSDCLAGKYQNEMCVFFCLPFDFVHHYPSRFPLLTSLLNSAFYLQFSPSLYPSVHFLLACFFSSFACLWVHVLYYKRWEPRWLLLLISQNVCVCFFSPYGAQRVHWGGVARATMTTSLHSWESGCALGNIAFFWPRYSDKACAPFSCFFFASLELAAFSRSQPIARKCCFDYLHAGRMWIWNHVRSKRAARAEEERIYICCAWSVEADSCPRRWGWSCWVSSWELDCSHSLAGLLCNPFD